MSSTTASDLLHPPVPSSDWRASLRWGYAIIAITFLGFGGWAAAARLDSAVVANGAISVESNRKTVQHLEGGIVREILVRDGDVVHQGEVLVRLDPTKDKALGDLHRKQLAAALALEARLLAQRDMASAVTFAPEVTEHAADPMVAAAINDNKRQFESRRQNLLLTLDVLDQQIAQAGQEIEQAKAEKLTAEQQLETVNRELPGIKSLLTKGLVALARVTALERTKYQLEGTISKAALDITKGGQKIAEVRARAEQAQQEYRQEAADALPDVRKTISDLRQQIIVSQDALRRIDITSPVDGTVQQLRVFTIGGVIKPGDAILDVVPASDTLVVRAQVSPLDIDRIRPDLPVEVRLPQFQRFQSEMIRGIVRSVSRDSIYDEASKKSYFAVEVSVDRSSVPKEINDKLTAGMTTNVVIPTGERTVLEYLISPILNRMNVSLRER